MRHARMVTRHFLDEGQLKGFSGSAGPFQVVGSFSEADMGGLLGGLDGL